MHKFLAGREPALIATLAGIAIKLMAAFWVDLPINAQSGLNAAVAAVIGLLVATTTRDGLSAAILGVAQAFIALALGFGFHIDGDIQATIMSGVAIVVGMFIRTQVIAPVPPPPASVPRTF